jgi:predicted ribosome quality control (RQC) complex YloA/Tae2 family protein
MDLISLAGVVGELTPLLTGASVQKVQQPDKSSVYIQFFSRSGAFKLRIATDHTAPRFHISTRKDPQPPSPLGFCQVARKHIEDAICSRIEMPGPDRIVWMHFENRSPDPKGDSRCALIFELMGRNSNLILVGNSGVVRGVLRPISATSPRPLKIGQTYTDPPGLRTDVNGSYGPLVDREAAALGGPEHRSALLARALQLPHSPVLVADADGTPEFAWPFPLKHIPAERQTDITNISRAWDNITRSQQADATSGKFWQAIQHRLDDALTYREKRTAELERTLAEAGRAQVDEETASLIMGQLGNIAPDAPSVVLEDWFNGGSRQVELDPKLTPVENANKWFAKASKLRDAAELADGRLADTMSERSELARLSVRLDTLLAGGDPDPSDPDVIDFLADLDAIAPERKAPQQQAAGESKWDGHRIRTFDIDGYTFLVGENATSNDYLLTRVARPQDIWMHIRAGTGAHGVIRVDSKETKVPEKLIRRAAAIVAAKSDATRHASVAAVDVAERRHVRKPRGAKPGMAVYSQCRTIDVAPDLGH